MIKNKDPRIKQIRESFCRLKAQLLLNFMILKIPMGSALCRCSFCAFNIVDFSLRKLLKAFAGDGLVET